MADLQALTIHQPWAYWIARGAKHIENRDWAPPHWMFGRPLAIHAGKTRADDEAARFAFERQLQVQLPREDELSFGAIIAVVELSAVITNERKLHDYPGVMGIDEALEKHVVTGDELRWFVGDYGWVMRQVVKLKSPVPCRGYQKLWRVPAEVLPKVREEFRAARPRQEKSA